MLTNQEFISLVNEHLFFDVKKFSCNLTWNKNTERLSYLSHCSWKTEQKNLMKQKTQALEIIHDWTNEIPVIYNIWRDGKQIYPKWSKLNISQSQGVLQVWKSCGNHTDHVSIFNLSKPQCALTLSQSNWSAIKITCKGEMHRTV